MPPELPPWPTDPPRFKTVLLRGFTVADVELARQLAVDPYVPQTGSLPAHADAAEALAWVRRQIGRHAEGTGYAFCVADAATDVGLGMVGLWCRDLMVGRASAGYSVAPSARGRGVAVEALNALLGFAWTIAALERVELLIEPRNTASLRTAERAGFRRERLAPSHTEIGGTRRDVYVYARVRADPVPGTVSG